MPRRKRGANLAPRSASAQSMRRARQQETEEEALALAAASSGIAATLLSRGRTAHSMFKLPLEMMDGQDYACSVPRESVTARLLKEAVVIIWDECTMADKRSVEALDKTLRDLRENSHPFGGCTIVFSGDFRQILSVIPRGTRVDEYNSCLKTSYLWNFLKIVELTTNMRAFLNGQSTTNEFSRTLLQLGHDAIEKDDNSMINIPLRLANQVYTETALFDFVYPNFLENYSSSTWLLERGILAPGNDNVT